MVVVVVVVLVVVVVVLVIETKRAVSGAFLSWWFDVLRL